MFSRIIADSTIGTHSVKLHGQIQVSKHYLGDDNSVILASLSALEHHASNGLEIDSLELLELWKDEKVPFPAKCLVTIWWGRPNHYVTSKVYSEHNLALLASKDLQSSFKALCEEKDVDNFSRKLEKLYDDFSQNGPFHLDGIGNSFFTKIFHFYFASHPIKSNPGYLPIIADAVMRSAVYAEMLDRVDIVSDVFSSRDAALITYVGYTNKFNQYAQELNIEPFTLETIIFNNSKGIGETYLSGNNGRVCLPHWIAGSFNAKSQSAIIFNNLIGETYLFEGPTAVLWNEILRYDYEQGFNIDEICQKCGCERFDLLSFFKELIDKKILTDHKIKGEGLDKIKKSVNRVKKAFLRSVQGVGNYHSVFESVDNDYRNIVASQRIPFAVSIELTYACNEACIHCYNPNSPREGGIGTEKVKPTGEMITDDYFHLLDEMKQIGVAKIVFTGGDPFMKKDFIRILNYAHHLKFALSVYTNGQAMYSNPKLYEAVRDVYPQYVGLSLYSTIPEVHDSITRRKGSCDKTKEVAKRCYEDAIGLQIKCPIMQANMDSYDGVYFFALSVNGMPQFDVNITSSIDGDCFASQRLRLNEEQLKTVLKDSRIPLSIENSVGSIERQPDMFFCGAGESSFNIQPDGSLVPCCSFPLNCGNVREQPLKTIWESSPKLHRLRLLRYRDSDLCGKEKFCKYCNRCMGQSFVEHGVPENHSTDNCFIAKIRCELAEKEQHKNHKIS